MEQAGIDSRRLIRRPLPWICAALAGGILLDAFGGNSLPGILLAGFLVSTVIYLISRRPRWLGMAFLLLAALLGGLRYQVASLVPPADVSRQAPMQAMLTGVVNSEIDAVYAAPGERYQRVRFLVRAATLGPQYRAADSKNASQEVTGEVEVSLPLLKDSHASGPERLPRYGDTVQLCGPLETPEGARNPGGYDERVALARRGIYARLTVRRPEEWHLLSHANSATSALNRLAYALKQGVLDHDHRAFAPLRAGVLDALLMGAKENLPPEVQETFARTGTAHLLGTAGLHVGLVAGLLLFLLPLFPIARRPALVLTLMGLVLYTLMTDGRASVVRAVIMTAVYLIGILLEREPDLPNALALAALGLLLANPFELFEPGFQISFATVLTLILGMPLIRPFLRMLEKRIRTDRPESKVMHRTVEYLAVCSGLTLCAQLGSLPLIAAYFNTLSVVGVLANILVVPVIAPLIMIGFAAAALGALSPGLALPCDWLLNALTAYILNVLRICSELPAASFSVPSPPPALICLYYAIVWWALWRMRRRVLAPSRGG